VLNLISKDTKILRNSNVYGIWKANGQIFVNRRNATIEASKNKSEIEWVWYHKTWKHFDTNLLGKVSLKKLYKERAQQLRDTYDYLILSYSGGADSHNVLMSFLDNNIKIDQLFIHMPFKVINSSKHEANTTDKTAKNLMSEWDYVISPTLKKLAVSHPDIKIELSDWTDNLDENMFKKDFSPITLDVWGVGNLARNINYSKLGQEQLDKGKKVCTIFGADKPNVGIKDDKVYMFFVDRPFLLMAYSTGTPEAFYKTPNLPHLAYEMAYQIYLYYKFNPNMRNFLWTEDTTLDKDMILATNNNIAKEVCYAHTWDFSKFQADKPLQLGIGKDRDWFVYGLPEFERVVDAWQYHYDGYFDGIDNHYLGVDNQFNKIRTVGYFLGDI
jgi:hypothetical protein